MLLSPLQEEGGQLQGAFQKEKTCLLSDMAAFVEATPRYLKKGEMLAKSSSDSLATQEALVTLSSFTAA